MKQLRPCLEIHSLVASVSMLLVILALCRPLSALAAASPADQGPPGAAKAPSPPVVEYAAGLLSVTAKDVDVRAVVEAIATKSGIEIALDRAITGKVTTEFKGLKFEEGLKAVLKDVVEGGFSSEYVKTTKVTGGLSLTNVRIARVGKEPMDRKDVLRITEITVQDAVGVEILFAKWGRGDGEIPILVREIAGKQYRIGFARLRVGESGDIYLLNWGTQRIYVFDAQGRYKREIGFSFQWSNFDVDHEGHIYLYDSTQYGARNSGEVIILGSDGRLIGKALIPKEAAFTPSAFIHDGVLWEPSTGASIFDFRSYLERPEQHSRIIKTIPRLRFTYVPGGNSEEGAQGGETYDVAGNGTNVITPFRFALPSGWMLDRDKIRPLGWHGDYLILLVSIASGSSQPLYSDYAVGVIDIKRRAAAYLRLREEDTFVFERGNLQEKDRHLAIDSEGHVYHLFTSESGVHVYKYSLGDVK